MIYKLWQFFLHDDAECFKQSLAAASYSSHTQKSGGGALAGPAAKVGSPGASSVGGVSPGNPSKYSRKNTGVSPGSSLPEKAGPSPSQPTGFSISRTDINARDTCGRTLLHLAASSHKETAYDFVVALLAVPFLDIYAQDAESGWTALHRSLYAGNVAISQALMARDIKDATDFSTRGAGYHHPSGGLIKIKDREGNSPFDVFGATVPRYSPERTTTQVRTERDESSAESSSDGDASLDVRNVHTHPHDKKQHLVKTRGNLMGEEVFTFGSNKNLTLGMGDEDDRQFPERITLRRPDSLLHRLGDERQTMRQARMGSTAAFERREFDNVADLPVLVRSQPLVCRDVVMSKLHTGIISTDPESNLFMCGFGPGGRLGAGDEATRFSFVCIQSGGLATKKVVALALGQDHSIAVSQQGEVFTWGSNRYGQLGYSLPRSANKKNDAPIQTTPRQIFNPFKKEVIIGAAASAIHSAVFTSTGLYTFGKNDGQLGLIDADARSLELQPLPRKVGASLLASPIAMVAAIDRATTCLLENHEVWVFTHYGYTKLVFPLDDDSAFLSDSFLTTRYGKAANYISKLTACGNTICAMSSFGEVYTINVSKKADTSSTEASTTNPAKIRNILRRPSRIWSVKKSHMAVRDVEVGQDGSIIICTESGSAWRKEKRAKIKTSKPISDQNVKDMHLMDYKFVRIPGLSRIVAVRSNAFGAYAAVQGSCEVTKEQIIVAKRGLWDDLWPLLPFKELLLRREERDISIDPSRWSHTSDTGKRKTDAEDALPVALESSLKEIIRSQASTDAYRDLVWVSSTACDVRIPVHEFMIAARSAVLRRALKQFRASYYYYIVDLLTIEYGKDGQIQIQFQDLSFLSIFNLVMFLYTDQVYDVWMKHRHSPHNAQFYRQVRVEVMKLASHLELKELEESTRLMFQPRLTMNLDMERAFQETCFFDTSDALIELSGAEVKAHGQVLCRRCPFFEGLFYGRSAGRWVSDRREGTDIGDVIRIDLRHIDPKVFSFVLRHIYADTDDELFEDVCTGDLDDLVDLIIDVMAVANELMLDRLAEVCQKLLGQFVNTRNVCHLLNAVAPCTVTSFKQAAFEFICLNLEVMLETRLLDDLDSELLFELDEVCRDKQMANLPISRARNTLEYGMERYPEIVPLLEHDVQRRIDSMRLSSRLHEDEMRDEKSRIGSLEKSRVTSSPAAAQTGRRMAPPSTAEAPSTPESPLLRAKQSTGEMMFQMDDDSILSSPTPSGAQKTASLSEAEASPHLHHRAAPTTPKAQSSTSENNDALPSPSPHSLERAPLVFAKGKQPSTSPVPPSEPSRSKAPWGSVESPSTKVGLSGIMAEASSTARQPSFSADPQSRREGGPSNFAASKLSQKERKKIKQQQIYEESTEPEPPKSNLSSSSSPWQPVPSKPQKAMLENDHQSRQSSQRSSSQTRAPSRTALTLRQTVAGTPPPSQDPAPAPKPTSNIGQQPSTSHPAQSQQPAYTPTPADMSRSATSSAQYSLATILQEQQTEKDSIREAATARHNLHDIQVEQEFQEWWDKESKRVMEEEAAAEAATRTKTGRSGRSAQATKGGRTNRGGSSRGRGKGGPRHAEQHQQHPDQQQQQARERGDDANANLASKTDSGIGHSEQSARNDGETTGHHHHPPAAVGDGRGSGGYGRRRDKRQHSQHHHNRGHHHQQQREQHG